MNRREKEERSRNKLWWKKGKYQSYEQPCKVKGKNDLILDHETSVEKGSIIREILGLRERRDGQSPRNLSSFPEQRTKRRLQGGPIEERATRQLPEITHRSPCPVERRHPTKARKRFGSREASEPLLRFDPLYARTYTREERLHTFSHGNRQAIVVIKETDEGTKRRNKRVGWSRPAVYGALHLLAPYNPPRASKRDLCGPTLRPTLHSIHYLLMVAALALGCPGPVSLI